MADSTLSQDAVGTMRGRNRNIAAVSGTLAWLAASASSAFAHGGMASPDELGRPLAASAAIAFACYWAVVLWPSPKSSNGAPSRKRKSTNRRRNRRGVAGAQGEPGADSLKLIERGSDG
jgi:hypothetical protein